MFQNIDKIFVLYINQNELNRIKYKLNNLGIIATYFRGIDGKIEQKDKHKHKHLSTGAYGHICSFINIIKESIKEGYKKILILEPDIYFATDFQNKISKYLDIITDYKLLYLGASQGNYYKENTWTYLDQFNIISNNYYSAYKTLGTFAIIIDNSLFTEYLSLLETFEHTSDVCLVKLQDKYRDKCFVVYPNIICCDVSISTTSNRASKIIQLDTIQLCRWFEEYDFTDCYKFTVDSDSFYKCEFTINSYFKLYNLVILDEQFINITPMIRELKLLKLFSTNNNYNIYFKTISNTIYLKVNNIFVNDIILTKIDNLNSNHINIVSIYKVIKSDLSEYYKKLINRNN